MSTRQLVVVLQIAHVVVMMEYFKVEESAISASLPPAPPEQQQQQKEKHTCSHAVICLFVLQHWNMSIFRRMKYANEHLASGRHI